MEEKEQSIAKSIKEYSDQISQLHIQLQEQESNFKEKLVLQRESITDDIQSIHDNQIAILRDKISSLEDSNRKALQEQEQEITSRLNKASSQQIQQLQLQLSQAQSQYKEQITAIKEEHSAEIDEMITQLDEVEAENEAHLQKTLQEVTSQKEVVISALSSHLAEERAKVETLEKEREEMMENLTSYEEHVNNLKQELEKRESEFEETVHALQLEKHHAERKIESDMRAAAEQQFADANKIYLQLQSNYDTVDEENAKLRKNAEEFEVHIDNLQRDHKNKEMECLAEVAQLRASLASAEASHVKTEQKFVAELEAAREVEYSLQSKLEEATTNCTQAHKSLAAVVGEKEKLQKENAELNGMCEELMGIVEARNFTN